MTLDDIKKLTETILNREFSGRSISEDQFNILAPNANFKLFEFYIDQLKKTSTQENPYLELLKRSTELRPFKVTKTGEESLPFSLPDDYKDYISLGIYDQNSIFRDSEFVTEQELNNYRTNVIVPNLNQYPKSCVIGTEIYSVPTNNTKYELRYLRVPKDIFYDYCVSLDDLQSRYMPVGSFIESVGGIWCLKSSSGEILYSNVEHPVHANQFYESLTVELEWNETVHPKIVYFILLEMGIKFKEELVVQYAMQQ